MNYQALVRKRKTPFNMIFCIFVMLIKATDATACPQKCECWTDKLRQLHVDCIKRSLTTVPGNIPSNVSFLNLTYNRFCVLKNQSFEKLTLLKSLDMSFNNLKQLQKECFAGLLSLQYLNLSHNNLPQNNNTYLPGIFQPLRKLVALNLESNSLSTETKLQYPDTALSDLVRLETLTLDGIQNGKFGEGFQNLSKLKELTMSSVTGYCVLDVLQNDTFVNVYSSALTRLSLYQCHIYQVHAGTFVGFKFLEFLELSENHHLGLEGLRNISFSLKETMISTLKLNRINTHGDPITVRGEIVKYLKTTKLKLLSLNGNLLSDAPSDFCTFLPKSLEYLSLNNNNFRHVNFMLSLYELENLLTLDMSFQSRSRASVNMFFSKMHKNIEQLDSMYYLTHADSGYRIPRNLRTLIANDMKLHYNVPGHTFPPNKVDFIDLSSNTLKGWLGKWNGADHLTFLNVSYNEMTQINPMSFGDMPNLEILLLQVNRFGDSFMEDTECLTFSNQTELKCLDLSDTMISELPFCSFTNLRKLEKLHLKRNSLTEINITFSFLRRLQFLDLSHNLLTQLNAETCQGLDLSQRHSSVTVDLSGNPLKCTCNEVHFLEWLSKTSVTLQNVEFTECTLKNGSKVNLMSSLEDLITELKYSCMVEIVAVSCIVGFFMLCALIGIPIIIYHKRWKLLYLYHVGRGNYNPLTSHDNPAYEFKAFISYADSSRSLVGRFERSIHNRTIFNPDVDMIAGERETTQIVNAISRSACVIVFLTKDYFHNFMKVFEFNVAITEGIKKKRQNIKVVLVEDIPLSTIDEEILMFCYGNQCDCYKYEGSHHEVQLFRYLDQDIELFNRMTGI